MALVVAAVEDGGAKPDAVRNKARELLEQRLDAVAARARRNDDEEQAFVEFGEIVEVDDAFAFFGAAVAEGEKAREAAVSGAVGWISDDVGCAVREDEPCADDEAHVDLLLARLAVGANDAGERIAVGDADGRETVI